ncbi:MAG TPA: protein-glutamate O-methyltransferase CheR [Candidatus Marinimicrobia bacterium]|nr:protein-glutamate O-methyltransferase CheR [Candidatus Neomarinimicrobiota bacterium]
MMVSTEKLSTVTFIKLRDFIYEKSGIFFAENKLYLLENRVGRRLRALDKETYENYLVFITKGGGNREELNFLYNEITINETYFFRYSKQLDFFTKQLLPNLLKECQEQGNNTIRIWSAASSSGEELYTIGMLIKEEINGAMTNWSFDLQGTDISKRILEKAQNGCYTKNSFRGEAPTYYKSKYFTIDGNNFRLKDSIKDMASFGYLNLNDHFKTRSMRDMDFIFCRNVLIYFDEEMKKQVVHALYGVLNHGGYLFLGEAESLHGVSSAFKVEHFRGAFVYKKE